MTVEVRTMSIEQREKMSWARGSIWPEVQKHAKLGLTPGEILMARRLEGLGELPYKRVENALRKAWKGGHLPRRTPGERRDARVRHLNSSQSDLEQRVQSILSDPKEELTGVFSEKPDLMPKDPIHRKYLWDLYRARKVWVENRDRSLVDNFPDYEGKYPNIKEELSDQISHVISLTSAQGKSSDSRAREAMVIYSEVEGMGS